MGCQARLATDGAMKAAVTKRARGQLSRQIVMETAVRLFNRQGYDRTSMNDVAQACSITKAGLYHYYPSKEDIFLAGIAAGATILDAEVAAAGAGRGGADPLVTFISGYGRALSDPVFRCLVLADKRALGAESGEAIHACKRRHQHQLEQLLRDSGRTAADARELALAVFGALNWTAFAFHTAVEREVARMIPTLIALVRAP